MKLSSLNFFDDDKSLEFVDEMGGKLGMFRSKQEALRTLTDFACKQMISPDLLASFQKEIMEKEKFPWLDDSEKSTSINQKLADEIIGGEVFSLLTALEALGMIGLLVNPLPMINPFYPSSFLPCNCRGQRGVIWTEFGFSTIISNKEDAYGLLNTLEKIGGIDESEISEIKKQVDQFYEES